MSSEKPRAARACTGCRRLKTRCYESKKPGSPCLRCEKLGAECSLALFATDASSRADGSTLDHSFEALTNARLNKLEEALSAVTNGLGVSYKHASQAADVPPPLPMGGHAATLTSSVSSGPAPVSAIRDIAAEVGVTSPAAGRSTASAQNPVSFDLISEGLLSTRQVLMLVDIFHEHYGRWVFFSNAATSKDLFDEIKVSPLLLCSVCLIAIRHTTEDLAATVAPELFDKAKSLLSMSLLTTWTDLEPFQAALILSMWSTTVGQTPLGIDSWMISGFAIQHCVSSDIFAGIFGRRPPGSHDNLKLLKLWNHLLLVHLHYAIGTKRRAMLGRAEVEICRRILTFDSATNFEYRMVAEAHLYWLIYENCCQGDIDLSATQSAFHKWRQDWKLVLDQPRAQFLEMGYGFAQLLAYDLSYKQASARARESLLSEMTRLADSMIHLAIDTTDERTKHLSDHIYHMITFAALTVCRLLSTQEIQLAMTHDIAQLDALVVNLVTWLRNIGLPCHAAFTLGDIIAAFHTKLRPSAARSPPAAFADLDIWSDTSFWAAFPDMLGPEAADLGNLEFLGD